MWQPPLPNIGKVKVIYRYLISGVKVEQFEIERYKTLVIRPILTYEGTRCRFISLSMSSGFLLLLKYMFYAKLPDYAPKSKSESWFDSGSEPSSPKSDMRSTAVRDT